MLLDQLAVLVHGLRPVRRQALDGEGPCDADALLVLVGLVVEVFEIGLGGDGGVDLLLPGNADLPEGIERLLGGFGPVGGRVTGDFPFHEAVRRGHLARGQLDLARGGEVDCLAGPAAGLDRERCGMACEQLVEGRADLLDGGLPLRPDLVDLGVVGDGFQRDVRHAPVDEAVTYVVVGGCGRRSRPRDLGLLSLPFFRVGEQIPRVTCPHDPGPGQCKGDARGVDGDPASSPLFGDVGGRAGTTGRVEHEIPGIGCHEEATFHESRCRLHNIKLFRPEPALSHIGPDVVVAHNCEIIEEPAIGERFSNSQKPVGFVQLRHAGGICLPAAF